MDPPALRLRRGVWARRSCARPISRTVIDVNRDPSGVSLYPGQATTGCAPSPPSMASRSIAASTRAAAEIAGAPRRYFDPYHAALCRPRSTGCAHSTASVVLYDAHSIRSAACPRLFDGELPHFNIGTNGGASLRPRARARGREHACAASGFSQVVNGRFKGGWTTRHYGRPRRRRPRHPDGARLPRLHARAGTPDAADQLAARPSTPAPRRTARRASTDILDGLHRLRPQA